MRIGERYIITSDTGEPGGRKELHVEVCSEEDADGHFDSTPYKLVGDEQVAAEKALAKKELYAKVVVEGTENNRAARREAAAKARKKHPPKKPEAGKTNKWDRENRHTRLNPSSK